MDFKNRKIILKRMLLGKMIENEGIIINFNYDNIEIDFGGRISKYSGEDFLKAVSNKTIMADYDIIDFLSEIKQEKDLKKAQEKEVKPYTNIKFKNEFSKMNKFKKKIYYVFQGQEYEREILGGYLFAGNDESIHHWKRLDDLKKGDIIIHGGFKSIIAISRVTSTVYQGCRNGENHIGKRVDCDCTELKHPIDLTSHRDAIQKACFGKKYQPFNKNGTGNQGYLFDLCTDLAIYFLNLIAESNEHLLNKLDYLNEILAGVNTFIFKYEKVSYLGILGYAVYDAQNEKIGVVWKHYHKKGETAEGQAEIRFFDEYKLKYHTWRRIFLCGEKLMYDYFIDELKNEMEIMLTIDPQKKI